MKYLIISVILVPLLAAVLLPLMTRTSIFELFPGTALPSVVDFRNLARSDSPNDFLVAPEDFLQIQPDQVSPILEVSSSRLQEEFLSVINSQPRIKLASSTSSGEFQFVQRSLLFKFPDLITVRFISLDGGFSTLAVYSRSVFGYSDLGVNKKRIQHWIGLLKQRIPEVRDTIPTEDHPGGTN